MAFGERSEAPPQRLGVKLAEDELARLSPELGC
jgi:hypothetical protein